MDEQSIKGWAREEAMALLPSAWGAEEWAAWVVEQPRGKELDDADAELFGRAAEKVGLDGKAAP